MNKKIIIRIILITLFLSIGSFIVFNENGLLKFLKLKSEIGTLNEKIEEANKKLKTLEVEIDSLLISKEKLERVAREKFHMMKPNEQTIRLEEK